MNRKKSYMFTNRRHSRKAIMATILGAISVASVSLAIYLTFRNGGEALLKYGFAVLLASVFSIVGLILAVMSRSEKERYYLFPYIGIILNVLTLICVAGMLYIG